MTKFLSFAGMAIITMMLCYLIAANFAPESVAVAQVEGFWATAQSLIGLAGIIVVAAVVLIITVIAAYARANETAYERNHARVAADERPQIVNHGTVHIHNHYHVAEQSPRVIEPPGATGRSLTHG